MDWVKRNAPEALLAGAMAASVALTLALTWDHTFIGDTWDYLMSRRAVTADSLFNPHNEHIVVLPVAVELVLLRLFGMTSALPEYVLLAVAHPATALLLFVYVRRRVGSWLALFATVLFLFLGAAWEVLLWPFELTFIGSVFFGIAMLLALERDDRRGDIAACAFLALALASSSIGIPFAAAAAVDFLQKRGTRGLRRIYVVAIPVALFALWYLGWGSEAETHVSLRNVLASPRSVAESMAAAVGSLLGLGQSPLGGDAEPVWGRAILVALVVALAYRSVRSPRLTINLAFWPIAAAAATNWVLTAFNQVPGRDPTASRYQYVGGVLVLLLLANLLKGTRVTRRTIALGAAVTILAVGPNLVVLKDGSNWFEQQSVFTRSDIAAIEIARRTVEPDFQLDPEVAGTPTLVNVFAAHYLTAVDEYGSPAYTVAELRSAPDYGRRQADIVLSHALPLSTHTQIGAYDPSASGENCVTLPPGGSSPRSGLRLPFGLTRIEVPPGPEASFSLRRFATGEFPVPTEGAPGDSVTILRVPRDEAPQAPWYLDVEASQPTRVCR